MSKTITLVSNDGVTFSGIDIDVAAKCKTIKRMLQNIVGEAEKDGVFITLQNVKGNVLSSVLDWLYLHEVRIICVVSSNKGA